MLEDTLLILAAMAIALGINLVPAFMPSTWMVLAYFYIQFDLPLLLLSVPGAVVSGLGRLLLARGSGAATHRLAGGEREDLRTLGDFLNRYRRHTGLAVFLYALSPLPTNHLFVAAGMVGLELAWVLFGFWAARIIADTFWVWTTDRVFHSLGDVFEGAFGNWIALALQVLGLLAVAAVFKLPWAKWLRAYIDHRDRQGSAAGEPR